VSRFQKSLALKKSMILPSIVCASLLARIAPTKPTRVGRREDAMTLDGKSAVLTGQWNFGSGSTRRKNFQAKCFCECKKRGP
jgi:hypothetical protein